MTQQLNQLTDHSIIVETPVSDCVCVNGSNCIGKPETGTLKTHTIRKIIKKSSVGYFCDQCNVHYARLSWVMEDHPGIEPKNFNIRDLRKEGI